MAVRCVASNHDLAEIGGAWAKTWKNRRSEERDLRYSLLIERTAEFLRCETLRYLLDPGKSPRLESGSSG